MIVVVAPYSPLDLSSKPHLGAARKIELVLSSLAAIDDVVLLNTAHNDNGCFSWFKWSERKLSGGVTVPVLNMPSVYTSKIGKFIHLFFYKAAWRFILEKGEPQCLWLYNGYSFESIFALNSPGHLNSKIVLELEDLHTARHRGLSFKPFIDRIFFSKLIGKVDFAWAVNDSVREYLTLHGVRSEVLQGIVDNRLSGPDVKSEVDTVSGPVKCGYFGGLSSEKGADLVLALGKNLPMGLELHVCGAGPLSNEFDEVNESGFFFHGCVDSDELYRTMRDCDVVVNPHSSIECMDNGVFPFKVVEYIASGCVVVSTELPKVELEGLLDGVVYFESNLDDLKCVLVSIARDLSLHRKKSESARDVALTFYSEKAFSKRCLDFIVESNS